MLGRNWNSLFLLDLSYLQQAIRLWWSFLNSENVVDVVTFWLDSEVEDLFTSRYLVIGFPQLGDAFGVMISE